MNQFACDVYLDLMPLVKDAVASEASNAVLKEHLQSCPTCRAYFEEMAQIPESTLDAGWKKVQRKLRLRTILALVAVVICCLTPFAILAIFCGNPISETLIRNHSQKYLEETYPGHDFVISNPQYNMKSLGYSVDVRSLTSQDTYFVLNYGYFGGECWDGYAEFVLSGSNTFSRLCDEVSDLVEPALIDELQGSYQYYIHLNSDWPSIYDEYGYPFAAPEEINISSLEVDGEYDLRQLSAQYGHIEITCMVSETSAEEMADILTRIYEALTAKEIAVRTLNVNIYDQETAMTIDGFLFTDIASQDLVQKVQQQADAWDEFQKEYDAWLVENHQ